jgi:hypothetical protein
MDKKLLNKIDHYTIFNFLNTYLNDCFRSLSNLFNKLGEIEKNGGQSYYISTIKNLFDSTLTGKDYGSLPDFISYIQKCFNIKGLDTDNSKIEEIKKNSLFKITSKKKVLFLETDEKKEKLSLSEVKNKNRTTIFEFDLEKIDPETYFINELRSESIEQNLIVFLRRIETEYKEIHLSNLVLKLLKFFYLEYNSRYNNRDIIDSYTLLANNHNFLTHLNKIKQDFDSQYNLFKSMTNTLR